MLGWHTLLSDWRSGNGHRRRAPWKIGDKRVCKGKIIPCIRGYHFCTELVDLVHYAYGNVVCRTESPDDSIREGGKLVGKWRKLIAGADCRDIFNEFALVAIRRKLIGEGLDEDVVDMLLVKNEYRSWDAISFEIERAGINDLYNDLTDAVFYVRYQDGIYAARSAIRRVSREWAEEWLQEKINARLALS